LTPNNIVSHYPLLLRGPPYSRPYYGMTSSVRLSVCLSFQFWSKSATEARRIFRFRGNIPTHARN